MHIEEQSLPTKIIRNTIFNIIGWFWGILVVLVLTPYIIGHIGIERYGIWAIVGVMTGYFGLLDFGIGTSFVKYIAEFYTKKDYEKINQVVNTGFVFYSIFAIFIITLAFFIINPLLAFFKIPSHLYNEALFVFLLGIIIFGISNALSPFRAIQVGLQRMDISNKVAIAISIPNIAGTIFFLEKGYGLPGLMVNNAIILVISSIANFIIAFKILPELRFNPFLFSREMFKKLFNFGYKVEIIRVADMLALQTDRVLIAYFSNIGLVGFYQLGNVIVSKTRESILLLISAVIPFSSEIDARNDTEKLYELYIKGTKYLSFVGIPLMTFVFFSAPLIILTWMGVGYEKSVLVIQLLAPCYLINFLAGMGTSISLGAGKPQFQMKAAVLHLVFNIVLSIILGIKFGFVGIISATLISLSFSSLYFMILFHKNFQYSLLNVVKKIFFIPIVFSLFLGCATFLVNYYLINPFSNRLTNLGVLLLEAFMFFGFYVVGILRTGYLDSYDKGLLRDKILCVRKSSWTKFS